MHKKETPSHGETEAALLFIQLKAKFATFLKMADKRRGVSAREKTRTQPRWDVFPQPKEKRQEQGCRYHLVKINFVLANLSARSVPNGEVGSQRYHSPGKHRMQPPVQKPAGDKAVMS